MGQIFSQLTQPGSALTDSGGNAAMVGDPSKIRDTLFKSSANFKPYANSPTDTGAPPVPGQSPLHNVGIGTPTFQQAASAGATPGGENALSPGLTKAGKLATLLQSGLQGALAGRAKSEETVAATGGRRSGGAGMGFEAGYTLPWQRQAQQNQLAQQQAQTGVLQSEAQNFNLPGVGQVPGWLAKTMGPAYLRSQATENAADTRAGASRDVANIGAGSRVQGAQIGADARIKAAQMGLGPLADVSPELQQQLGLPAKLPLKMLNQAESAANKPLTVVAGENDSYVVNKRTNAKTPLGVGNRGAGAAQARPVVAAADPNDPGNLTYMPAGQAMKTGALAPQSAATGAAKTEAKSEVPTRIGDQKVAFTTMIQHADLLRRAAKALNNGNTQTLNGLENAFKNEFGYSGPITSAAIADAYKGEVSNVINKGHITDTGNEKIAHTLDPTKQNFETIDSVLSAYQALAQSKMDMLNKQANAAKNPKGAAAPANPPTNNQTNDPFAKFGGRLHQ